MKQAKTSKKLQKQVFIFRKPAEVSSYGANVLEDAEIANSKKENAWRSARDPVQNKLAVTELRTP